MEGGGITRGAGYRNTETGNTSKPRELGRA